MTSRITAKRQTQIDVDAYIARARQMRGECIARGVTSGVTYLRTLLTPRGGRSAPEVQA